jgi:hypothetical protein
MIEASKNPAAAIEGRLRSVRVNDPDSSTSSSALAEWGVNGRRRGVRP